MSAPRPFLALALAVLGCGSAATIEQPSPPAQQASCGEAAPAPLVATGTTCPPGGTALRFTGGAPSSFGQGFMDAYCTRCHATTVTGNARQGAPAGANFDDLCSIRARAQIMDAYAGSTGTKTFTIMPLTPPDPTTAQRVQLSEWLSCGAP